MLENGDPNKYTAMSKTVGMTTALTVKLLLEGKI